VNILMAMRGVIRNEAGLPITQGVELYAALVQVARVSIALDDDNPESVEHWMRIEGMTGHQGIIPHDLIGDNLRVTQVQRLRAQGFNPTLIIDPNPTTCAALLREGYTALLFSHPKFSLPEFRPDYQQQVKPWNDIVEETEQQVRLKYRERPLPE
jgi:hypothetical protein